MKGRTVLVILAALVSFLTGCSAAVEPVVPTVRPTLTPSLSPFPSPTRIQPTDIPTPTRITPPTVTPGPSPTPLLGFAPTPQFMLTPTEQVIIPGTLRIEYFASDVETAQPGATVTLYWAVRGVELATIYRISAEGDRGQSWSVARAGSLQVRIAAEAVSEVQFLLLAGTDASNVNQTLSIRLVCPDGSPINPEGDCTAPLAITPGLVAQQPFQQGLMLWIQSQQRIYVLYDGGEWDSFPDQFQEGQPESDPSINPPQGVLQPIRGFGLVWRTQAGVRDRVGWATGGEFSFASDVQGNASVGGRMTIREQDGTVLEITNGGTWRRISP